MAYSPEDSEEEVYPKDDSYRSQALVALPSKDFQLLITRPRSLIPGGV